MTRHGDWGSPLYIRWNAMRQRVRGKYSQRGIGIDPAWDDYAAFRDWALANGWSADLTLDRIDNDGDYGPNNCRWTTTLVQNRNRRPAHLMRSRNRRIPRADWPQIAGRIAAGEPCKDIAASYGVGVQRIHNISSEIRTSTGAS